MKAAVLTELNAPLALMDLELPALQYGQVRVRLTVSGICGAQLQEIRGEKGNGKYLPHLLGHEGCGYVEDFGVGVSRVKAGDKVVLHWRKAAGIEAPAPVYQKIGRTFGEKVFAGPVTTFNTHAIVSENRCTPVPRETPDEFCALLGCGLSTALGTIEHEAELKIGESVLIIGCGGLGVNLIRAARMRCASRIVVVDHADKRHLAFYLGAQFYNGRIPDEQFDVVIDTSGNDVAIAGALTAMAPGGRFIMVGQPKPGQMVELLNARHLFEGEGKRIIATQGGRFQPHLDIPRYVRLHSAGLFDISSLISERLPLDHINNGLDLVRAGQASRVMIRMS
jgi:S-(hydroxymethyl)glutathione dehydrogenase/alcohol dehydrogenase